jgi:hypothetical protein
MLKKYDSFNESRNNKKKKHGQRGQHGGTLVWDGSRVRGSYDKGNVVHTAQPRGMNMDFSPRFKYILGKMDKKGNKIAKDLLSVLNKPDAKFEFSFLDLTGRADTVSYIANADRNIPDEEKYKTNRRQHSKVYKTIKTIFGSKYTKTEVTKFVSLYKQIYEEGPDDAAISRNKRSDEQLLKKIATDTKNGNLKWTEEKSDITGMERYEAKIKITDKKSLLFIFFILGTKNLSFITINLYNSLYPSRSGEWINTYQYKDLTDFLTAFKEKYNKDVI